MGEGTAQGLGGGDAATEAAGIPRLPGYRSRAVGMEPARFWPTEFGAPPVG
jgi:hypothetical protein